MLYQYIAYNEGGQLVRGQLAAASEQSAVDMLSYVGYRAINLHPFAPFFSTERLLSRFFKVKPAEVILFYRQLALLLESGINIVTALELLQEQSANRKMKKVLEEAVSGLRSGQQLSTALGKHPEVFSRIYCQSLRIGEQTGGLETILRQIADYMEKEVEAAKSIKSALTYPVIVAVVTVIVVGVLVAFVLPAFGNLYSSLEAELPAMTRFILDGSAKLRSSGLYIMLGIIVGGGLAMAYIRTPEGSHKKDRLLLVAPLVGRVVHLNELSRCCRAISLLFKAGLSLTEIMPLVIQSSRNKVVAQALTGVQQDMLKGEGLSRPMGKNKIFLPMMVQMVKVGEETGNLDTALLSISKSYEAEAEDKTRAFIALIQPAMTLLIAAVVGVIALSLVSAMYSIYGQAF